MIATDSHYSDTRLTTTGQRVVVYLILTTVSLINFISYAPLELRAHEKAWGDALNYYAMSEHTGAQVDNPFALRMLSPWLVHMGGKISGLALDTVWVGFTFVITLACTVVFFEFCRRQLKLQTFTSALAAIALGCTFWYGPYAFSNPYLVDPLNNLLYLVALWLLLRRKLVWFTVVVILGAINKETTLLLAPLYPLLTWTRTRSLRDRQVLAGIVAVLIAAVAYIAFRLWAQSLIGGTYGFGSGQANKGLLSNIYFALSSNKRGEHAALFDTFHFFWILFAYGLYHQYRKHGPRNELLIAGGWLILCCLAGRMVATDTQRVFVMLAPLVIALVAITLDNQRTNARQLLTGILVFLYLALNLQFVPNETKFLVEIIGLGLFALLIIPRFRVLPTRDRPENSGDDHFISHRGTLDHPIAPHRR
ncbi:hypothetical protein B0293_14095 [Amycolatopsis azurea DSM 43854]|uniref:Integral membrane protein n=1 Tax=Amycolatopsis azurea DSM 43854 TaxID=1238180 RepID=A0ABX3JFX0_9PSEU|nr:hypothetical protein B0293_14095 [Amycolatopsis azurea DSM 43854]